MDVSIASHDMGEHEDVEEPDVEADEEDVFSSSL